LWQFAGRGQSVTALLRSIAVRLARAGLGPIDYWMKLPLSELMQYMNELSKQIEAENAAQ